MCLATRQNNRLVYNNTDWSSWESEWKHPLNVLSYKEILPTGEGQNTLIHNAVWSSWGSKRTIWVCWTTRQKTNTQTKTDWCVTILTGVREDQLAPSEFAELQGETPSEFAELQGEKNSQSVLSYEAKKNNNKKTDWCVTILTGVHEGQLAHSDCADLRGKKIKTKQTDV